MIQFTQEAQTDLTDIASWIGEENPIAADQVMERIFSAIEPLDVFPQMGRIGRVAGTRELSISGLPYIIVYRTTSDLQTVLRVLHGARLWPEE